MKWTEEEQTKLIESVNQNTTNGRINWILIAENLVGRSAN